MAGGSFFILLDDIAAILDDVAAMTKVAAKKTAGVVGDDLAVNAQQVTGVSAERELPIVWQVAKGSFWNKVKIIPLALLLSALSKVLVMIALMLGGIYLCYEGAEKIFGHSAENEDKKTLSEEEKIDGAIKTDFVLSGEIMVIALGSAAALPFLSQVLVLSVIGIAMTVGVYGLVALIVKADDVGIFLLEVNKENFSAKFSKRCEFLGEILPLRIVAVLNNSIYLISSMLFNNQLGIKFINFFGKQLVFLMPKFMKFLTIAGTIAMFMVGGGIFTHNLHDIELITTLMHYVPVDGVIGKILPLIIDIVLGLIVGVISIIVINTVINPLLKYCGKFKNN